MLIFGTLLAERFDAGTWRVGLQLGAQRAWFLERCGDGRLRTTRYGPSDFALTGPAGDDPPGEAPGGVREPRRPTPPAGGASVAVDPLDGIG